MRVTPFLDSPLPLPPTPPLLPSSPSPISLLPLPSSPSPFFSLPSSPSPFSLSHLLPSPFSLSLLLPLLSPPSPHLPTFVANREIKRLNILFNTDQITHYSCITNRPVLRHHRIRHDAIMHKKEPTKHDIGLSRRRNKA